MTIVIPVVFRHINEGGGPLCVLEVDVINVSVIHYHMVLEKVKI